MGRKRQKQFFCKFCGDIIEWITDSSSGDSIPLDAGMPWRHVCGNKYQIQRFDTR